MSWSDYLPATLIPDSFADAFLSSKDWVTCFHYWLIENWIVDYDDDPPNATADLLTWCNYLLEPLGPSGFTVTPGEELNGVEAQFAMFASAVRDESAADPIIPQAFVFGHGGVGASAKPVIVPLGMQVRYLTIPGDLLLSGLGVKAIQDGVNAKTYITYAGGAPIPNYRMTAPKNSVERSVIMAAASGTGLPLFIVGDDPLSDDETYLCTMPDRCGKAHRCTGVLARLGHVADLISVSCTGVYGDPLPLPTTALPGEGPGAALNLLGHAVSSRVGSKETVAKSIDSLPHDEALQRLTDPAAQRKAFIFKMKNFAESNGPLAYKARYEACNTLEKEWLDGEARLVKFRSAAERRLEEFTSADDEKRAKIVKRLGAKAINLRALLPWYPTWEQNLDIMHLKHIIDYQNRTGLARAADLNGGHVHFYYAGGRLLCETLKDAAFPYEQDTAAVNRQIARGIRITVRIFSHPGGKAHSIVVQECPEEHQGAVGTILFETFQAALGPDLTCNNLNFTK